MDVEEVAEEVYQDSYKDIKRYVDILTDKAVTWGLIGPREVPRLWERHILNSVALADLIPQGATVLDVGSGAGLPGLPLAIARPDLQVTLLDSLLRRVTFLDETVAELALGDRVSVTRGRAEELKGSYDVVVARAVAPLEKLIGWCGHLISPRGSLLVFKGDSANREVDEADQFLARRKMNATVLQVRAHPQADLTTVVRVRRS